MTSAELVTAIKGERRSYFPDDPDQFIGNVFTHIAYYFDSKGEGAIGEAIRRFKQLSVDEPWRWGDEEDSDE